MTSVIDQYCLALNSGWQPISFYKLSTAIANVMREQARVMVPETYELVSFEDWCSEDRKVSRQIKTASGYVPAPEIIVLAHYGRVPPRRVGFNSPNLGRRDDYTCQFCGGELNGRSLTIDHVVPRSRGGGTSWENCVAACTPCNSKKADRLPREAGMPLLKKPGRPDWKPGLKVPETSLRSWAAFLGKVNVA